MNKSNPKPSARSAFRVAALICPVLLLLSRFAAAAEMQPAEKAGLMARLKELREKHPALRADFVEEKMSHLLNKPLSTEGTMEFSIPDKFRRVVKGNNPSTTISNGKVLWIYYPKFKEAELYTLGQHSFFDDSMQALTAGFSFEHFDEFYNLKAFSEDGGYRLILTPKHSNLKRLVKELTLWLDAACTPLKGHLILPKGDEVTTVYKNVVRTQIPDATFDFTPPADTHISHPLGK